MTKIRQKHIGQTPAEYDAASLSHGILSEWDDKRGYGFITPSDGGQKVFLHIKSLLPSARRPVAGEMFFYKLTADAKGRPRAENAFQTIYDERRSIPFHHALLRGLACFWPLAFLPALVVAARTGSVASGIFAAFAANSLLTVLFYWEDKRLAQNKCWRISEKSLHFWELLCGWPGALYAQHAFRHKRSKISFMIVFWLCAIANVAGLFLLFSHADTAQIGKTLEEWWRSIASLLN